MRVLVCGDRHWTDAGVVAKRLRPLPAGTTIVHGGARGADSLAASLGRGFGYEVEAFPAEWNKHGRAAGPLRNRKMLESSVGLVVAFHSDIKQSRGTKDMVRQARDAGVEVEIITGVEDES